ncbi:mucin-associated surface protein [Arthrobacter rhizosphaerae]|uniref:mucin-associated surface protein n=1 Tax=Arthrobacter rhizosphaerae TaxID=2855490 RepID=UPI001FF426E2|nr:mucin-associated surface protein [Arthrobacter rhizosphaerae]
MSRTAFRRVCAAVTGSLLVFSLAACGPAEPELGHDAAKRLQSRVLTVTDLAAANDPAGALVALFELEEQLEAAGANGEVSFKRHQSIMTAIEAVRTDLLAAQSAAQAKAAAEAAAASASPTPTAPQEGKVEEPKKDESGKDNKGGDDGKGKDD